MNQKNLPKGVSVFKLCVPYAGKPFSSGHTEIVSHPIFKKSSEVLPKKFLSHFESFMAKDKLGVWLSTPGMLLFLK